MSDLTKRLSGLNPFSSNSEKRTESEDDDKGEEIDATTVAGGGHGGRTSEITKNQLRVSQALRSYLVDRMVLTEAEAGVDAEDDGRPSTAALKALLEQSHIQVPAALTERSRPLPEYFISSSHNTYLLAHQLFGASCATAYETALSTGSRCVEIDAWDNPDDRSEPKVTHGYTLVSNIPFRLVCETIRDVVDRGAAAEAAEGHRQGGYQAAPILLSLENHCDAQGQQRLVDIMLEVFGDRLLSKPVRYKGGAAEEAGYGPHVPLEELGSKVVVMVEYHFPDECADSDSDTSSSEEEEAERNARREYKRKRKEAAAANSVIIPALAELGVYVQSVKPQNDSWFEDAAAKAEPALPHHHLINVSESGLARHLPGAARNISAHNAHHLMRVYPKGTRISSRNLQPRQFWAVGAQVCALNWQTFGAAMQINEALFSGTDGFVLKPAHLRPGGLGLASMARRLPRRRLRLHVAGATDVPLPPERAAAADDVKLYLTCTLMHPGGETKRKTRPYRRHRLTAFLRPGRESPEPTDPLWDETLEWEYDDDELVFLRLLVKSDDAFARNPLFAVAAVRLLYVPRDAGWSFIRLLDLKGRETTCTLLVKMEIQDR